LRMEKTVERIEKIISIESISKEIKGRNILKNVSFDILRGEILALVGPNGAGKTTTVRCLSGIFNIDSGVINKMEGLDISVMPEKDFFWEKYTGWKNIKICFDYFKGILTREKIEYYINMLGLSGFLTKKVYTYSKGTKRKLSFVLALLSDPDLLILDEPMSGLDPLSRKNMRNLILELNEDGKSILLTSHDLAEVEKLADRVIVMKDGKILVDNLINDTLSKYKSLEDLFFDIVGRN